MAQETRSADQMVNILLRDPAQLKEIATQKNPAEKLRELADQAKSEAPAYYGDKLVYRIVVIALGLVVIIAAIGSIILIMGGNKETPTILVALGSAGIGALAGLLAPSPTSK